MTDELDPQTQQHIDDSADVTADADAVTCDDIDLDDPFLDESATAETPETENADEQNDDAPAQDDAPVQDAAPQAAGPIEVSSEEELDAVMDSMMDAVKAMKDAVADADVDAEEEEAAEAASTFVPGETPVADQGSTMPSFLQLEHPTIGADAVDPHAAGFSVVEGGTGNISVPQAADADAADTARPTASHSPAANRDLGTAVSNTANAVGTFIAQGASAMREMNAAKKALADARAHLAELEQRIADQAEELETRQDIAGRYDQIVADQRQAIATAQKTAAAAEIDRDAHAAKATELKGQLEQMKTEDDATELRLKAALDAVEAREASSRETGNRLVRRLEDSKRIRDKVKAERDAGIAAAQQTADATRAQLETLRHEYAELQRNPSANPANYTVRTSELSMQISDTADALRKAEEDVPRITADLEHSLAAAEQAVEQAQAPIADAKRAHQAVTAEADAARDELQTAKTAAATRQRELREKIGDDKVVLGLSGGVDSTVAAVLLHRAIGENLHCIFVDSGLLRKNEFESVLDSYKGMGLNVKGVKAGDKFLGDLAGVSDPERKRKIIGRDFVEVFNEEAIQIKDVRWLAQGTIYPDVIESCSVNGPSATIKSHHNVGGLPEKMNLKIVEPLRLLFKDEVRRVGRSLGIGEELIGRHPFPGPGLAIRILGEITPERVEILQNVDKIYIDALREHGLYDQVWQAGVILLPVKSVGVMGDERTYESCVALRAVASTDGMTADWVHLPYEFLARVSNDIINKVRGVNRVVYDISSKPPATIEWE